MAAKDRRGIIPNRIGMEKRPDIVKEKTRFGDLKINTIARMTVNVLRPYKDLLKTNTSDNGKDFGGHEFITRELGTDFYFVRSYHSCDRGANEHMNGLIRQYVKKEPPSNTGPRKKSLGLKRN